MDLNDFLEKKANFIVIFLLLLLFIQAITSIRYKSVTVDEISHLSSGYSYIKTGDFRLNVEALPLVDMISALPLLFLNPTLPLDRTSWMLAKDYEFEGQFHWEFGEQFFYGYGNDADKILFFGRIPMILLSMLLGFYVFKFAKELFGVKSGLFALFLYSFSPNILAHSRLATIDLGATCFIFIAVYYFWRFVNDVSVKSLVIAGITFGLAQLSKFTALYLIPIYGILTIIVVIIRKKENISFFKAILSEKAFTLYGLLLAIFVIGFIILTSGYGFFQFRRYIDGFVYILFHSKQGHPAYLLGMHSSKGWWYYFIIAFLIKTPIATLILIILSLIFFRKLKHKNILAEYFLMVPPAFIFSTFFFNHINIGLRHILPIYPFIFVCVSRLINLKRLKWILGVLGVWYLLSSLMIYPHYLAYFNEFVMPENGYKFLADSNIDWGQDLKGLKLWMEKNDIKSIRLGYWGKDSPEYRKINYTQVNCYPEVGLLAVSVNNIAGLTEERRVCLEWLKKYKPIANIGYSILIYDIPVVNSTKLAEDFCKRECKRLCEKKGYNYGKSGFLNGSCDCGCLYTHGQ